MVYAVFWAFERLAAKRWASCKQRYRRCNMQRLRCKQCSSHIMSWWHSTTSKHCHTHGPGHLSFYTLSYNYTCTFLFRFLWLLDKKNSSNNFESVCKVMKWSCVRLISQKLNCLKTYELPCHGAAGFLSDLGTVYHPVVEATPWREWAVKYDELVWFCCGYFFDDFDWLILCVADSNESVGVSYQLAGEDWIHCGTG